VVITAVTIVIMLGDYFLAIPSVKSIAIEVRDTAVLIAAFAIGLGIINLSLYHGQTILKKGRNWPLSAILLLTMFVMFFIGVFLSPQNEAYRFMFDNVYSAVGSTMWGLLAFYLASSSYRAIRVRNFESLVLVICTISLMLMNAPVGSLLPLVPEIGDWIQTVVSAAGMRGIIMGTAIGSIGIGVRILLGRERIRGA